eukprot:CAMPEP_0201566378 /NCGR_PEP_ID=MMETSP0190_2-20130828/6114_1 /ASSEMBLY_ACC=CAM_ASM_000263 /TAXON_ID=37353 /ORGANISM="Rosalina sp." /LENGTH=708 /DNA_ID=CAMNT_0047985003 /DNA_START=31 /DNA_END=2157 /DNA_ORIENTATION=+
MATSQINAAKLKALQQAFITADKDGDSLLKEDEFKEFVEIGYQKQCPKDMYANLCRHFSKDPTIGIDWKTAREVWVQAQGKQKSPSPPKSQQNGKSTSSNPSNVIKQAFIQCDKDADGFLNKAEFHEFVKVGFKKPSVPNGMYEQVCGHFKKDPTKGIDWLSCFALWKQSNPNAAKPTSPSIESGSPKKNRTPPPKKQSNQRPPNLRRVQTTMNTSTSKKGSSNNNLSSLNRAGQLSPSQSTGNVMTRHRSQESLSGSGSALTERNLRALDHKNGYRMNGNGRQDDEVSVESDRSYRSQRENRSHRRAQSRSGRGNGSFDDGQDASQMVVQMMESKVKNLQNQLKLERMKRKKTDELAQSLLTQNEEYKRQIGDLQSSSTKHRSENKQFKDSLRKFKTQVDDDRQTIKHLQTQCKTMKNERDESYELLTKIEKEHQMMIKKEKAKHKAEIERLSTGFLQSLGAEPGKDVSTVIKELRQTNQDLKEKVDTLAATLERKNASLLEALQAVDTITNEEEKTNEKINAMASQSMSQINNQNGGGNGKMRERLRSFNQRRKSFGLKNNNIQNAMNSGSMEANGGLTGLPRPPKRRNSQVGLNGNAMSSLKGAHHRPTATFFKKIGDNELNGDGNNKLTADKAKNGKEAQFVAQQLTAENAQQTDNIHNLETVNTALMAKLKTMEQQMQQLQKGSNDNNKHSKNESNGTITDLP